MPYWDIVSRSFRIAWNHKYLWLIGLFSGEGGGFSFNYSQSSPPPSRTSPAPDVAAFQRQVLDWLGAHVGLLVALGILWLAIAIALFILAAVCEGATVRGSAEHDADRPFGLRDAWRMGVHTMWVIVRLRLLVALLYVPLVLLIGAWALALLAAILNQSSAAVAPLILTALALVLVWIVYGAYLFFLDRFGNRVVVLEEQRSATAALARAHRLLIKRLGRSVLLLLLSIGVGIAIGIGLACVLAIVLVPLAMIGTAATLGSGTSTPPWPLIILGVVILIPLSLLIGGFLSAQGSTYWTLAFRRLDLDYAPAYGYPAAPQFPPAPQA